MRHVESQIFATLLEQFENIVALFVLDSAHEQGSQEPVINLDVLGLIGQIDESVRVLLVSFAPFQEHHKLKECLLTYVVPIGDEVLHGGSQQRGKLLLDSNKSKHLNELGINFVGILVL